MKKLICVAAAFAMVAGVATVASAEVKLSGDARARFRLMDNGTADYAKFDSRLRVKFDASTESGVYAKARLRFYDGTWGTGAFATDDAGNPTNKWTADRGYNNSGNVLSTDYGYIGFKSNGFNVSAGRQVLNWSEFFVWDKRADRLKVTYKTGGTVVGYTYDQVAETTSADRDIFKHGVLLKQKISDTAKVAARLVHVTKDSVDKDGFVADVYATMNFAGNNVRVEAAYKEADAAGTADDAFGALASWNATLGSFTPTVRVGLTQDGYVADDQFGWLMIGDIWGTSTGYRVGQGGDTIFAGVSADFAASEKLSFQGNAVYLDVDAATDDTVTEISAMVSYKVVKGATLSLKSGTLIYADSEDTFNTVARLDVNF